MKWININDHLPKDFQSVIAVVQYLDAEWDFEYGGYDHKKHFWTLPMIVKTYGYSINSGEYHWNCGGKVTHWIQIPNLPDQEKDINLLPPQPLIKYGMDLN